MQQIADFHIHSKYSRACSRELTLPNIEKTCRIKGVDIIATGDFTYPEWFSDIKNELEEIPLPTSPCKGEELRNPPLGKGGRRGGVGLYKLKSAKDDKVKFILSTELALIYKSGDKVRRVHLVAHAPNIKAVEELNKYLDKRYNIRSDGRPILGMSAPELVKLCLSIHPKFMIYPAHIWTPWFSVFGSKSGFNSMEECFREYTKDIYAYETGLSSDPEMNWRLSALDKLTLLSNSDAHSLPNIAREANVFELNEVTYEEIYNVIKNNATSSEFSSVKYTIEFYPEEGMYHYDGHRDCGISCAPQETKKQKGICPKCKKPLTIGVMHRVEELADREEGYVPKNTPGFKKLVELDKIIAEALGVKSRGAARVRMEYNNIIKQLGSELYVLIDAPLEDIKKATLPAIAEGIKRVREGKLIIEPGFDGQYGVIKIFSEEERKNNQLSLF
jgi:uncharacterized protein (TIGR00375 family)